MIVYRSVRQYSFTFAQALVMIKEIQRKLRTPMTSSLTILFIYSNTIFILLSGDKNNDCHINCLVLFLEIHFLLISFFLTSIKKQKQIFLDKYSLTLKYFWSSPIISNFTTAQPYSE